MWFLERSRFVSNLATEYLLLHGKNLERARKFLDGGIRIIANRFSHTFYRPPPWCLVPSFDVRWLWCITDSFDICASAYSLHPLLFLCECGLICGAIYSNVPNSYRWPVFSVVCFAFGSPRSHDVSRVLRPYRLTFFVHLFRRPYNPIQVDFVNPEVTIGNQTLDKGISPRAHHAVSGLVKSGPWLARSSEKATRSQIFYHGKDYPPCCMLLLRLFSVETAALGHSEFTQMKRFSLYI